MTKSTFAVALLVTLAASACSSGIDPTGSGQAELGSTAAVPPGDPPDANSAEWCFDAMVSASACTASSSLYAKAAANCSASSGVLRTFDVGLGCPKGEGQDAKYRCCSAPPPPPPIEPCFVVDIGDAKTCRGDSELETLGQAECGAKNAKMTKMSPDYGCPNASIQGMSHFAKIECCTQ